MPHHSNGFLPLVDLVFRVAEAVLLARIVCSWLPVDRRSTWYLQLWRITEPFLKTFRDLLPTSSGIDFSPILAFFALDILRIMVFRVVG